MAIASPSSSSRTKRLRRSLRLLLQPGIGIKRWFLLAVFGLTLMALGISFIVSVSLGSKIIDIGRILTFGHLLTPFWRGVLFGAMGIAIAGVALYRAYRTMQFGATYSLDGRGVLEGLSSHRTRRRGPRVVAIGGGTGLSTLLRGLKEHCEQIAAVVTVSDDGGSSGRLRTELTMPAPGDARQCLVALSDSEPLMEELFSYRFTTGNGLSGHSVGNLMLAALTHSRGSFHEALQATAKLLAVKGQVIPSSVDPDLILMAQTQSGRILSGESVIGTAHERIQRLWLDPSPSEVNPAALEAIANAEIIVIGPGSLFTSILPNFLVQGIAEAVRKANVPKVLVCNIATEHGETDELSASDHLRIFRGHSGVRITHFLANARQTTIAPEFHQEPLVVGSDIEGFEGQVVLRDMVSAEVPSRHDSQKLALAVLDIARAAAIRWT